MTTYKVRAVCRPALAAGFALAGVTALPCTSPEEAEARIRELAADGGVGLILLEEDLIPEDAVARAGRGALPMIVPLPAPSGSRLPGGAAAYVAEILRRAIGYRVRLQ